MRVRVLAAVAGLALLAGCASPWPSGSYAHLGEASDVGVMADAITTYLATTLPRGAAVALKPSGDDRIATVLAADLEAAGLDVSGKNATSGAYQVAYVVAQMNDGTLLRVVVNDAYGASRFFSRATDGRLQPAGPMMVVQK